MQENPNESILGMVIAMAEVGLNIYLFVTKDKRCGLKIPEETAKDILPPEIIEKGQKENGEVIFEGQAADEVNRELIEKDLITDERYKKIAENNENLYEEATDEYFPLSDFELDSEEDLEIGG